MDEENVKLTQIHLKFKLLLVLRLCK